MRVVQALHWMRDMLGQDEANQKLLRRLRRLLNDPDQGDRLRADLADGLPTLPAWMQVLSAHLGRSYAYEQGSVRSRTSTWRLAPHADLNELKSYPNIASLLDHACLHLEPTYLHVGIAHWTRRHAIKLVG